MENTTGHTSCKKEKWDLDSIQSDHSETLLFLVYHMVSERDKRGDRNPEKEDEVGKEKGDRQRHTQ